jgi:hypothetical protein
MAKCNQNECHKKISKRAIQPATNESSGGMPWQENDLMVYKPGVSALLTITLPLKPAGSLEIN